VRLRDAASLLIVGLTLAGCAEANPTPTPAPTTPPTVTAPAVAATLPAPTAAPAATSGLLPFAHTACAPGVDLTGQTITFYQLTDLHHTQNTNIKLGLEDASDYFNAHGGICGARLNNDYPDPTKDYEVTSAYRRVVGQSPKPVLIGLYQSDDAADLSGQLATDQIPGLGLWTGAVRGLYGEDGQHPSWVFSLDPADPDQFGVFCQHVAGHAQQFPNPVVGYLAINDTTGRAAYTPETIAYCASLGVKVLDPAGYFPQESADIHAAVQQLLDGGANILYTNEPGPYPALIAKTLGQMGLRNSVTLGAGSVGFDNSIGLTGKGDLGSDGLPLINGLIGSMPLRSWFEADQAGIQLIAQQADLRQRPLSVRNNFYLMGWTTVDLFIELYIQTGNRVGFDHLTGSEIKKTLETIVYKSLGLETIDFRDGTRRALATDRMGQLAFLGRDGKNAAGPNNPPLVVNEGGTLNPIPILVPLTDFRPAPDLRPGGGDVPAGVTAATPTAATPTAAAAPPSTPALAAPIPLLGRVAFVSVRTGKAQIYVMPPLGPRAQVNGDGSGPVNISHDAANDLRPAWSPDGTRIAFQTDRDGNLEIYVMNADGSNPINLTNSPADDEDPSWSPDGKSIAFDSDRDGNLEVYMLDVASRHVTRLTSNPAIDQLPAWSPDGQHIAFTSFRDGNGEIYVTTPQASFPVRLTHQLGDDAFPEWSPDGKHIVYCSDCSNLQAISVMNADGSEPTVLTQPSAANAFPYWSPDGKEISFISNRDGNWQIYIMYTDGSDQTHVILDPADDFSMVWQP